MKLYAVVEPLYDSVRIFAICADENRAKKIKMEKLAAGQDAQIAVYDDGYSRKTIFKFDGNGEFIGYADGETKKPGVETFEDRILNIFVEADTIYEAQKKALEILMNHLFDRMKENEERMRENKSRGLQI